MLARTALPPNANFGLSDCSYWSSGLIYVSELVRLVGSVGRVRITAYGYH